MWESQKATAQWGKSQAYSAPTRIWAWDEDLGDVNGGPPGAPRVVELNKRAWTTSSGTFST